MESSEYPHFMLKEIEEQPEVLNRCLSEYLPSLAPVPSAADRQNLLAIPSQIHILACGTSRHAGLVAQYWYEQVTGIPTRVRSGSEFVSAPLPLEPGTLTLAITQSGETSDTLAAVKLRQEQRRDVEMIAPCPLVGITNQPESTLTQLVDRTFLTLAGNEIGVAATKTFTSQLAVLFGLLVSFIQQQPKWDGERLQKLITAAHSLPPLLADLLQQQTLAAMATRFETAKSCIVLGQGVNRAIALEGALKLKETTYIHAEGYAAGEFWHGPIALVDETTPVIAIAPADHTYKQVMATVEKARSHQAPVLCLTPASPIDDPGQIIALPVVDPLLSPFLTVLPLQLLAYHIAVQRGFDVDKPRNITKTVL